MKDNEITKLMYKSLDAPLSEREKELLDNALNNSAELSGEYKELLDMRSGISKSGEGAEFKPFFEERVLGKINSCLQKEESLASYSSSLIVSFKRIGFAAIFILIALLSYNLKSGNSHSLQSVFGVSESGYEYYAFDPVHNLIGSNK